MEMKRKLVDSNNDLKNKKMKTVNNLEPDIINYISVPSLVSMTIVNVATALCKQLDIRDSIRQHSLKYDPEGWTFRGDDYNHSLDRIEKDILKNLSLLPLPNILKAKVSNIIRPIVTEILKWIKYERRDVEYLDAISWTNEGTVDVLVTLKQLINKDTGQHTYRIYKLACTHCLEEIIPNLWANLSDNTKDFLYSKRTYKTYCKHLIAYWTFSVNNQQSQLFSKLKPMDDREMYSLHHSVYHNMFKLALSEGNSSAVKYFWNKLSYEEISCNLKQWVNDVVNSRGKVCCRKCYGTHSDILYFLLSKMEDREQQEEVLQQNSKLILNTLFAAWPWQRFLLPTINRMWNLLDKKVYVEFLRDIAYQIKESKTTEQLFSRIWCNSPINLKKCFIQYMVSKCYTDILCNLLIVKDIGTVKEILHYADVEEQKKIVSSLVENSELLEVIYANSLSLFCILIETFSESDKSCFKRRITLKHGNRLCYKWICDNAWEMIDNFLNWGLASQDEIDIFKSETINKIQITYDLLYDKHKYELVNKFMTWCFDSVEKINQFKKYFAKSQLQIVRIGSEDWCLFEKFIDWCFDSEQEINDFKTDVLEYYQSHDLVHGYLAYSYNFEFIDKLISWCCYSSEEIKQFKTEFVFTRAFFEVLQKFVSNYEINDSDWNNWELIEKLMKLFSPLEAGTIIELKEKIATEINFDDFHSDYEDRAIEIEKEDVWNLLDDYNYIANDEVSPDISDKDLDKSCNDEDPSTVLQVLNDTLIRIC